MLITIGNDIDKYQSLESLTDLGSIRRGKQDSPEISATESDDGNYGRLINT